MTPLFDRVRELLAGLAPEDEGAPDEAEARRVAVAALMFRVVDADGTVRESEATRLREVLAESYGLDAARADALAEAGRAADHGATDLYEHTSLLRRSLEMEERVRLIELLFELAYADDSLHEGEDATVKRIAELLGVDARERVLARRAVAERRGASVTPEN